MSRPSNEALSAERSARAFAAWLMATAVSLMLLACCSGSDSSDGNTLAETAAAEEVESSVEATSAPSATAAPTAEPSATPTPEPSATPVPTPSPTPVPERTTIDELLARGEPLSLAHAGGDQAAPHSTMFAFKEAARIGADVLEIDVQLTADGELIVHHDLTVDGTTNGSGLALEFTLAEIQALDNAHWFAEECWPCRELDDDAYLYRGVRTGDRPPPPGYSQDDFRIVTLRELAEQFPEMPFDIEIKGEAPEALAVADALATEIQALELNDNVVVVSFDDDIVAAFEAAAPGVETSPGTDELTFWVLADVPIEGNRIIQVPPFFDGFEVVNEELIERAADAGLDIWVWPNDASTQENTSFYRELIALGVDGIIAGRPADMEAARG